MIRSFKYRLHPNKKQEATLNSWLLACGTMWNWGLEQRKYAYETTGKSVSKYDQYKEITELNRFDRSLDEGDRTWSNVPPIILRSPLCKLDLAFKAFLSRVKSGSTPGYPRFK